MNTLIVYDSQYGNTARVAQALADALRAFGQAQAVHVDQAYSIPLQGVDLLIVGSPTQGFQPTLALHSFVANISTQRLRRMAVACFDTRFRGFIWEHSAATHLGQQLRTIGNEPLVPPESFYVKSLKKPGPLLDGELERAGAWALGVQQKYEVQVAHLVKA